MDPEAQETTMFHNFYADYYTMAGIAVASCMALCPAVGLMGRRGGLLMFMIITALASLLQLGLLNCEYFMRDTCPLRKISHWWCLVALNICGTLNHSIQRSSVTCFEL